MNRRPRRRLILVIATLAIAAAVPLAAQEEKRQRRCSEGFLKGDFSMLATGAQPVFGSNPPAVEHAVVLELATFDGEGGITFLADLHGDTSGPVTGVESHGTYTVGADCRGEATVDIGLPVPLIVRFIVTDRGDGLQFMAVSPPGLAVGGTGRRVWSTPGN